MSGLNKTDKTYLQRLVQGPVQFTHAIDVNGRKTKLGRSTVSVSLQKHYHRLAVGGYCAEAVTGCNGHNEPPETTVTYTLSALGRAELGIHKEPPPPVNRSQPLSDVELYLEGIE